MGALETLAGVLNLRLIGTVLLLVGLVFLAGWLMEKNKKARRQKPGMLLEYTAPGQTAAGCRSLLMAPGEHDVLRYLLEADKGGGWFFHLQEHRPSQQPLDTVYRLSFTAEEPAAFQLQFVREAFGQREPIIPEALLDEFFAQKLGAQRQPPPSA